MTDQKLWQTIIDVTGYVCTESELEDIIYAVRQYIEVTPKCRSRKYRIAAAFYRFYKQSLK